MSPTSRSLKTRLDQAVFDLGLVSSRTKAQALILAGRVLVNSMVQTKAGLLIEKNDRIEFLSLPRFVSRGGEKLEGALVDFNIDVAGQVCMDVGSSTGGFTDCLLQRGAARVYSIDVGTAQMDSRLKLNEKIVLMERTHILELKPDQLDPRPTLAVIDVSFISLRKVLPKVTDLVQKNATILALVKPQFEVGPKRLHKGVVKSEQDRQQVVHELKSVATNCGLSVIGVAPARLKGVKGNQEIFLHCHVDL